MHVTKVSLSLILCIEVYIKAHLSAASTYRTINLEIIVDPAFISRCFGVRHQKRVQYSRIPSRWQCLH